MSFLLSRPGKSACHFMFDCSSKSEQAEVEAAVEVVAVAREGGGGGFLCTGPACCQHATYIIVAGCQRDEIPHLELKAVRAGGSISVAKIND